MKNTYVEEIFQFIKENPGVTEKEIDVDYSFELIKNSVLSLRIRQEICNVGKSLYVTADFPRIAPDTALIYREIRQNPVKGVTYEALLEKTKYPREVVREELKFLKENKRIYIDEERYYPVFVPEPESTHPLVDSLDFLTREELIALCKLFLQQTKWAQESIEGAERLVNSRRTNVDPKTGENNFARTLQLKSGKEEFTDAGGQFAGVMPDGSINLKF